MRDLLLQIGNFQKYQPSFRRPAWFCNETTRVFLISDTVITFLFTDVSDNFLLDIYIYYET